MQPFGEKDVEISSIIERYQGFFKVNEYHIKHALFAGGMTNSFTREVFERGDGVVLLPYDPNNDRVVLQQQFRVGAIRAGENPWLLECVAGMFGKSESPIDVAVREAQEEANLIVSPEDIEPIFKYFASPGGSTEAIHLYVGKVDSTDVGGVFGLPAENEDILVQTFSREEALSLLNEGKITNAATIIGLQWLAMNYQSLREKWRNK